MSRHEVWRLLPYHVGSSDVHFRLSDSLARLQVRPTVWWHSADTPTLIIGAGQKHAATDALALPLVKRQTGGTSIFATPHVLGLDVALPKSHALVHDDVVESYRWLGDVWTEVLSDLGASTRTVSVAESRNAVSPPSDIARSVQQACFGTLSPHEVVAGGKKIVGLAQVRRSTGIVLQAGIHLRFDAEGLARLVAGDNWERVSQELQARATGLEDITSATVSISDLQCAFSDVLKRRHNVIMERGTWTRSEVEHAGLDDEEIRTGEFVDGPNQSRRTLDALNSGEDEHTVS